jgi:hypothetical protein
MQGQTVKSYDKIKMSLGLVLLLLRIFDSWHFCSILHKRVFFEVSDCKILKQDNIFLELPHHTSVVNT